MVAPNADGRVTSTARLFFNRELLVLLIVGIVSLVSLDLLTVQRIAYDERYRQRLTGEKIRAQLQSELNEHVIALTSLSVVYQNFVDINAYDFQQYGTSIVHHAWGYRRIFFISPNYSIEQVYPLTTGNKGLYGLSLSGNAQLTRWMDEARKGHAPLITPFFTYLEKPQSVLAIMPVYRNSKEFLGYAVGELDMEALWERLDTTAYLVQLYDENDKPYFKQLVFDPELIQANLALEVANSQWTLSIQPQETHFHRVLEQRIILWAIGLSIILLMLFLLIRSRHHKAAFDSAQKQLETMFNASPDGLLLLERDLTVNLANPQVKHWTGYSDEQLSQLGFFELFQCRCPHLQKCQELGFLLCTSDVFEEPLPETLEVQMVSPDPDAPKVLRLNAARLKSPEVSERSQGFICILGDISASKELAQEKESFVATLTHDLRTPLLAQEMVLEQLASGNPGPINEGQAKIIEGAVQSVRDLLDMVNVTLLYYKIESAHLQLTLLPGSISNMVRDVITRMKPLAHQRDMDILFEEDADLPKVLVDSVQMKRVFHNLISNAISYGEKHTHIQVALRHDPTTSSVLMSVENTGRGIMPEEVDQVFEKYYSLSRKFKQIGTGLGLYIAKRIVDMHQGEISVASEPGKQTCFTIRLPEVNGNYVEPFSGEASEAESAHNSAH